MVTRIRDEVPTTRSDSEGISGIAVCTDTPFLGRAALLLKHRAILWIVRWILLAAIALATPSQESACFGDCTRCIIRCKRSSEPEACRQSCLESKRSCCKSCGAGPGPLKVCTCT